MLKDDFYHIQNLHEEDNAVEAMIVLNEHHEIFKGHFPGQPVLPGACMLQMTKEMLETFFNKKLQLSKAGDIRFSALVDPLKDKTLKFQIAYVYAGEQSVHITAKILKQDDSVCCKIKAAFNLPDNQHPPGTF